MPRRMSKTKASVGAVRKKASTGKKTNAATGRKKAGAGKVSQHTNPNLAAANAQTTRKRKPPPAEAATAQPTQSKSKPPAPASGQSSPPSQLPAKIRERLGQLPQAQVLKFLNQYEVSVKKKKKK